jgi:beta-N-acetylhexosaminidase
MTHPVSRWLALFALALTAACTSPTTPPKPAAPPPPVAISVPPAPSAEDLLARMTLEQKIAQLMVIGFDTLPYDAGVREMIEHYQVGGIIFFARNVDSPAQVAQLNNEFQASALAHGGIGLLIAIDQEGGRVARLTSNKGFTEFPGAMAIGASARDAKIAAANARRVGAAMAAEMAAVGINVNFAPDLDVNNNPANPVIGIRSFSSDPARVAALGAAYIEGTQHAGVLAFGKHFPGHGDTGTDSHLDLPVVAHPRARLEAVEFVPFKAAIAAHVAGIMSAHISFPTIDATPGLPGTLSPKVLTGLLRDELGFDGLVATDSLEMGALGRSGFPGPRAAARALAAGADLLLFNTGYAVHRETIERIAADVRGGVIPLARLDQAVRRVLRAKEKFGLLKPAPADPARAATICGAPANQALAAEITNASITLLRDEAARLPLAKGASPVVIAVPSAAKLAEFLHGTDVRITENVSERDANAALAAVRAHPGAPVVFTFAGANASQFELAKKILATGAAVTLVAVREPYDLMTPAKFPGAPALVATYGANPLALQALAAVVRGEKIPAGHLPVELPGLFPLGHGREKFTAK